MLSLQTPRRTFQRDNHRPPLSLIMINPNLKVQFRDLTPSLAVIARMQSELRKLSRHHGNIRNCRATISTPDHHHQHGRHFQLRLEMDLDGAVIVVDHEPSARRALASAKSGRASKSVELDADHKDAYVAIRDAFLIAHRRLDEHVRKNLTRARRGKKIGGAI